MRPCPLPPYRTFPEPVEVTVTITRPSWPVAGTFRGVAHGWRGTRVYVAFRTGVAENRLGRMITFAHFPGAPRDRGGADIYTMNADGTDVVNIANSPTNSDNANWEAASW